MVRREYTREGSKRGLRGGESHPRGEIGGPYDIYIVAQVEEMKAENAWLRAERRKLVRENAELNESLSRHERAACYGTGV